HQDLPFEKLVDELAPQRDLARNPLFDVMLVMQNLPSNDVRLGDLKLAQFAQSSGEAKFELMMSIAEDAAGGFSGVLEFAANLFARDTAERIVAHWQRILADAVHNPSVRIGDLRLTSTEERTALVTGANLGPRVDQPCASLVKRFVQLALQQPDC